MQSDSQLATIILYGAGLLIIGLFGWVVTTIRAMTLEMATWRTALFGIPPDFANGMRGDIKKLREDVDALRYGRRATDTP